MQFCTLVVQASCLTFQSFGLNHKRYIEDWAKVKSKITVDFY